MTWQQIVSSVIGVIFIGIVSWMGATVKAGLDDIEDLKTRMVAVETVIDTDLQNTIDVLKEELRDHSTEMGSFNANQKKIEIMVNRLDAIVERLEDALR